MLSRHRAAQNLCQIPAALLQHLVGGSAAFVVLGARIGAVGDEKLDDLGAVLCVPVRLVQGSASIFVSDAHALRILTQQRADSIDSSVLDGVADRRKLKQILNDVPMALVVCDARPPSATDGRECPPGCAPHRRTARAARTA